MGPHTLPRMQTLPVILTPIPPTHFTSSSNNNNNSSSSSSSNEGKPSVLPSKLITAVPHSLSDKPQENLTIFRGNRPQYNTTLSAINPMQLPSLPKVIYQHRSLPLYLHIRRHGSMVVTNPKNSNAVTVPTAHRFMPPNTTGPAGPSQPKPAQTGPIKRPTVNIGPAPTHAGAKRKKIRKSDSPEPPYGGEEGATDSDSDDYDESGLGMSGRIDIGLSGLGVVGRGKRERGSRL